MLAQWLPPWPWGLVGWASLTTIFPVLRAC